MNTILQKRIEKAAHQYIQSDAVEPENMQLAFGDFINGAMWALQNQWISVEKALPEYDRCCLAMYEDGGIIVAKYEDKDWWWQDGFVVGRNSQGDLMYSSSCKVPDGLITHWMEIPSLEGGEK